MTEVIKKHIFNNLLHDHDQPQEKIYQKIDELNKIGNHKIESKDFCIFLNSLLNPHNEK